METETETEIEYKITTIRFRYEGKLYGLMQGLDSGMFMLVELLKPESNLIYEGRYENLVSAIVALSKGLY